MKRILPLLLSLLLLTGCGGNTSDGSYEQITQEAAKEIMDTQEVIILDVREQDEYDSGHIPGAVLLPVGTIDEKYCCRGDSREGFHGAGLLPQRKPQQDCVLYSGRPGLHRHLRVRRHQYLAL